MRRFAFEDLDSGQFETLVVFLCQELLGLGTQAFSTGPDGGRDARFNGRANMLPSESDPWDGQVIVQAKHTNGYLKTFSDSDFFSATATTPTLNLEIPRVKKLIDQNELDFYILFSNRRLSANVENAIRAYISNETGLAESSLHLVGIEQLEILLKRFPKVIERANLDPIDAPLLIDSFDLAAVVGAIASAFSSGSDIYDDLPVPRESYEEKNAYNNMSPEFAEYLRKRYLKECAAVKSFLSDPGNYEVLRSYEDAADEFERKIIAKRKNYQCFDDLYNYIKDLLLQRDPDLRKNKPLTSTVLFYMYWNCDIGTMNNVASK